MLSFNMPSNFVKTVARHDGFPDAVRKYKVRERANVVLGLELGFGFGFVLGVAYVIECNTTLCI